MRIYLRSKSMAHAHKLQKVRYAIIRMGMHKQNHEAMFHTFVYVCRILYSTHYTRTRSIQFAVDAWQKRYKHATRTVMDQNK